MIVLLQHNVTRLCVEYFELGLQQQEILHVMELYHGIVISTRTLQRKLADLGLRRRQPPNMYAAVCFIQEQVAQTGGLFGYRWMHTKCKAKGIPITRDLVATIMQVVDPQGVELRLRRRLRRREYFAKGPNFIWHIDGFDKVKPFGIAVHGCIDGFSRQVIWLDAHISNNDPKLVGGYFVTAIEKLGGCPCIVRGDRGTENTTVCDMQRYIRRTERSFLYGRSTANQRIEFLWGILRRQCIQYWMDILGILQDDGDFSGDSLDKQLVQFCFMDRVQVC